MLARLVDDLRRPGDGAGREALNELAVRSLPRLTRIAEGFRRHKRFTADDLVQEAWTGGLRRLVCGTTRVVDSAHFFRLARRTLRSTWVDLSRRHAALKRSGGGGPAEGVAPAADVGVREDVRGTVSQLSAQERRVARLVLIEGRSQAEASELLGTPRSRLRTTLKRVQTLLQRELADYRESGDGA